MVHFISWKQRWQRIFARRQKTSNPGIEVGINGKISATTTIRLLRNERSPMIGFHHLRSPSIETHFVCSDIEATIQYLRDQSAAIASQNPFVLGWLVTVHENSCRGGRTEVALQFPTKPDIAKCRAWLQQVFIDESNDRAFTAALDKCLVKPGCEIIDHVEEPVVKICVLRARPNAHNNKQQQKVVLTISVSHVIGEPNLLYNLLRMLSSYDDLAGKKRNSVSRLIPLRAHSFRGNPVTAMKGDARRKFLWYVLRSSASPLHRQKRLLLQNISPNNNDIVVHCCEVNQQWIHEQKENHIPTKEIPYITTQDILTSWFFSQFELSCIAMAYDLRGRCNRQNLTSNHVGNYQDVLVLYPAEYQHPARIRHAIQSQGKTSAITNGNKPGPRRAPVGGMTAWHTHFGSTGIQLPHATLTHHLPMRCSNGKMPPLQDLPKMKIFKTSPESYAVWTATVGDLKDRRALGKDLLQELME